MASMYIKYDKCAVPAGGTVSGKFYVRFEEEAGLKAVVVVVHGEQVSRRTKNVSFSLHSLPTNSTNPEPLPPISTQRTDRQ